MTRVSPAASARTLTHCQSLTSDSVKYGREAWRSQTSVVTLLAVVEYCGIRPSSTWNSVANPLNAFTMPAVPRQTMVGFPAFSVGATSPKVR